MESYKALMTRLFLYLLGLTAMATQVIMIRETLAVFCGNELIIGLFLGMWMMLAAIGSFIATKFFQVRSSRFVAPGSQSHTSMPPNFPASPPLRLPTSLLLLLAMLPLATLFSLAFLRFKFISFGIMAGLGQTALVIFLALAPFCLVSGMLFPILVRELSSIKEKNLLHEGYALDSAGSILGGLLFSLVFIFIMSSFDSLLLLALVSIFLLIICAVMLRRKVSAVSILITGIILITLYILIKPDHLVNYFQFRKQGVIEIKYSPFGKLAVTRIGEQIFIYENGIPVPLGDDAVYREESAHYAMLLHPLPEKVLLLSGGSSGIVEEILKYPVERVDYVETDPWLIRLIGKYRPFPDDKRVNYIFRDPRIFLHKNDEKYDVILINTPEPNSAELNRFYTVEFLKLLKEKLNPGGIIALSVPAAGNYMNETSRQVHSVNYNTLKVAFKNTRVIPGGKDYYLASDSSLAHSIFRNYPLQGFTNQYVNPFYINEDLQKMRSDLIMNDINHDAPVNSDLRPYVFSLFLRQWLERFKINGWIIPVVLIIAVLIVFIFSGPLNLGLFTGGFTASSLEFLLLIWFQVMYGYVYQMTGVIFAVFMAGMAMGSFFRGKIYNNCTFRGFLTIQGIIAAFSALLALLMLVIPTGSSNRYMIILILILLFINGLLTGMQFSLSASLRKSDILKSSGESFSADLLGSATGILLVSVYLVPLVGLPMTATVLAGLNIAASGVMALKR